MAGTITRDQLVQRVRYHLSAWPDNSNLPEAMNANGNVLVFDDTMYLDYIHPKSLIQIDNEIMRVVDNPSESLNVRVIRGYMGTTPAAHAKDATVSIYPSWGWTDYELINFHLPDAAKFLKPYFWTHQTSDTFTWSNNALTATVPTNSGISFPDGNAIDRLLYADSSSIYRPFDGWRILGTTIHFNRQGPGNTTLKAEYLKFVGVPASASTAIDLDDAAEPMALYAASLALNALKTNRVRFAEYSASLNDRASTADELVRIGYDLRNQAIVAREERGRQAPGGYINTYRNP